MKRLLIAVAICLLMAGAVNAAQINLAWDYPAEEEQYIDGFRLYWGAASHAGETDPVDVSTPAPYDNSQDIADPSARAHTMTLGPGTYYFRMTVYGTINGQPDDSAFNANEVNAMAGLVAPSNVVGTIILTIP